jgi:hypothetical protein
VRLARSSATPGQAERAARYLSKYVSKERAADWLREKAGQRVFYVAPWLSRAAGASMRIARLGRRLWASKHGYCARPRCTDEELEAVMKVPRCSRWASRVGSLGAAAERSTRRVKPAARPNVVRDPIEALEMLLLDDSPA